MPVLQLKVAPLQNPQRYAQLARALTHITAQVLHKKPEVTTVLIEDLPAMRWAVASEPVSQATALLEINITQGTNTAHEKAQWIERCFAELTDQLGHGQPLATGSYCIVRELPATDWGYDGQTQAARRLQQHAAVV
jgi:4-oxalocrotonate tautomerase